MLFTLVLSASSEFISESSAVEGDFLSAIEGMHGAEACAEDIVAQEDCLLLGISVENINRFYESYPEMNIIMRKILERYYKKAHKRSVFFRIGTAAEKYQYFCETYPAFIERIPIALIASFLNIKLSTLQKIIANVNQKNKTRAQNTSLSKDEIIQFITDHKAFRQKKMTLAEVAKQLKVSPHELSRLLNQYFSKNFNQFLNDYRIHYALKMMLEHNNMEQFSLEGIGNDAGFGSRSTFFAEFKKRAGKSPTDYMKSKKERTGEGKVNQS